MAEPRPLAILVFDAVGILLCSSREAAELTGHRVEEGEHFTLWCRRMFPDPAAFRTIQDAFEAALKDPVGSVHGLECAARFQTAGGQWKTGGFTFTRLPQAPGRATQIMVRFAEPTAPGKDRPAGEERDSFERALGQIGAAGQELLHLAEAIQKRIIASALRVRADQPGDPGAWDELLGETFALARIRELAATLALATERARQASHTPIQLADPDRPLTGAAIDKPVALPLGISLQKLERFWILSTLQALQGNRTRCAQQLQIALRTVRNKLDEYRTDGFRVPTGVRGRRVGTRTASGKQGVAPLAD